MQVYIYTLDADTNQYNLTQTLSGNSTSVTGFGTDIGEDSHGLIPRPALALHSWLCLRKSDIVVAAALPTCMITRQSILVLSCIQPTCVWTTVFN